MTSKSKGSRGALAAASTSSSSGASHHFSEESKRQQERQQELYSWLQIEYARLLQLQEAIKKNKEGSHAHARLHEEYKTRHSAYQMKLGEYHQCQQTILNAVKKGEFISRAIPQGGTRIAPAQQQEQQTHVNNSSINNSSINNNSINNSSSGGQSNRSIVRRRSRFCRPG